MTTRKRILLSIGFFTFVIVVGYLLYIVFFAPAKPPSPVNVDTPITGEEGRFPVGSEANRNTTSPTTSSTLPTRNPREQSSITIEREEPTISLGYFGAVNSATLNANGGVNFYDNGDGTFYRLDASGNVQALSDEKFFNVQDVTWASGKDIAVLEYPDGANIIYNFETKKQVTLPKHWEEFSFDTTGASIAAKSIGISRDNQWLVTVDENGKNISLIEPMGDNAHKVIVDWSPNEQVIGFSRTGQPLGNNRQEILLVGQHGENFKSLVVEGQDFRPLWSPTGKQLAYSVYSARTDFRPELWIVQSSGDAIGEGRKFLNLQTWADKCVFGDSDQYIYCGVPETLGQGAGFVPESANATRDIIFKIDTRTGAKTRLTDENDRFITVEQIIVSEQANKLFIKDVHRSGIYEIAL